MITDIVISEDARLLYNNLLLCSGNVKERQFAASSLCIELCRCFNLKVFELRVCNVPQDSRTVNGVCVSKKRGKYVPQQRMVVIFNKTAVRKQIVSIKVFADTVLQQFVFYENPNTIDFISRVSGLKRALLS
jgi:hypothetical protein